MTEPAAAPLIVSIDSGSSYFKLFDGSTRLTPFPAAVHTVPAQSAAGDDEELSFDGKRYLVGVDALCEDTRLAMAPNTDGKFHGSEAQAVQTAYAFHKAGVKGAMDALAVSLPYDLATKPGYEKLRDGIKARKHYAWSTKRGSHEVTFKEVFIVAQGVGAWARYRMGNRAKSHDCAVVADIGSCTLDIVTLRLAGERYRYSTPACGSLRQKASVSAFFDGWSGLLRQQDGLQTRALSYYQLMQAAMSDKLRLPHMDQEVDLRPSYDESRRAFTMLVKDAIEDSVGKELWPGVNRIILTGGGAKLLCSESWRDLRIEVMDSWANVEGQYHMVRDRLSHRASAAPIRPTATTSTEAIASVN